MPASPKKLWVAEQKALCFRSGNIFLRSEDWGAAWDTISCRNSDGYVELETPSGTVAGFLEVDLGHEHRAVWEQKAERYLDLKDADAPKVERFQRPFRLLVILPSERRLRSIRNAVAQVTKKIFWFASLESIRHRIDYSACSGHHPGFKLR